MTTAIQVIEQDKDMKPEEKRQFVDGILRTMIVSARTGQEIINQVKLEDIQQDALAGKGLELDELKHSWSETILGAFGPLTITPPQAPYPAEGSIANTAGPIYSPGFSQTVQKGISRDATNMRGDLDLIVLQLAQKKMVPNAESADIFARGLIASQRSAIAALGFDPTKFAVEHSKEDLNLGGFYSPTKDQGMVMAQTPSALVHESLHRGLKLLEDHGDLSDDEKALIKGHNEETVRYLMAKVMGDPEKGSGSIADKQREGAIIAFEQAPYGRAHLQQALISLEEKAKTLLPKLRAGRGH